MLEVAEILRLHGAAYLARFADRLLPSHRRALRDLDACRTPAMGGHVHQCDHCERQVYAFHSCLMESARFWGVRAPSRSQTLGNPSVQRAVDSP